MRPRFCQHKARTGPFLRYKPLEYATCGILHLHFKPRLRKQAGFFGFSRTADWSKSLYFGQGRA
jgi:hypothetical protein